MPMEYALSKSKQATHESHEPLGRKERTNVPDYAAEIGSHYGKPGLAAQIISALRTSGKDADSLNRQDLSSFDEFHNGGLEGTRELASLTGMKPGMSVLDVGSGIGGPARTLAAEFGCNVIGIDITEEFVSTAQTLTELLEMTKQVSFRHASALEMPFQANYFDAAWSQNVLMNIPDVGKLMQELHRVLRPGGRFVFQTQTSERPNELEYPLMWASSPSTNFMLPAQELREIVRNNGFKEILWDENPPQLPPPSEGPGYEMIVDFDLAEVREAGRKNQEAGRLGLVRAVVEAH